MISALVSAYFAEKYIQQRLDNLMGQGCEIVVICQDGSLEHRVSKEYPCKIIPTGGIPTLPAAWNMGIQMSEGEYLTSANCDDILYPEALSTLGKYLDDHPECAIVHGDCDLKDGNSIRPWKRTPPSVSPTHCTVGPQPLWRKSLHAKHGYFDPELAVSQDFDFWLRCQTYGERIDHVDFVTGYWLKRDDNISGKNRARWVEEDRLIRERYA